MPLVYACIRFVVVMQLNKIPLLYVYDIKQII